MGSKQQTAQAKPEGIRRWVKLTVGVICLVAGLGFLWTVTIKPLQAYTTVQTWRAVPCEIVGRDTAGPAVRVRYQYEIDGTIFRSDRLRPLEFGDRVGGDPRLPQYQPGAKSVCYVDPVNPAMAVLDRNFGWNWLFICLPVPLLVIGVIGLRARFPKRRRALFDEK